MTSASKTRLERRAQKAVDKATAYKVGDPARAIITLTEIPGTGGFTIGMGLHGARMEELFPGQSFPISIVDVVALAINHTLRTNPQDFQNSVNLVNSTLRNVQSQIEAGVPANEAIAGVDEALDQAVADVEAPAEPSDGE